MLQLHARLNEFIGKLRATPAQRPQGKARGRPIPNHATFEDALDAAQRCTKCRVSKFASKGCSACMGSWFAQVRQRGKAPSQHNQ